MFASSPRLIAFSGLFVVAASFIPGKARAQDNYEAPRNADVPLAGATRVRIEAAAGSFANARDMVKPVRLSRRRIMR